MSTTNVDAEHLTHIVDETLTDGLEVTALCGYTWTPDPDAPRNPFCSTCIDLDNPGTDADLSSLTVAELRDLAEQRTIDLTGLKRKADIVEAIAAAQV